MKEKTKIIFATKNNGKFIEVKNIFNGSAFEILSLNGIENIPDIDEDGLTFEANAKKKAKEIFEIIRVPVIADDSGLSVEQLNGKPGVFSARFAGENATYKDNNTKLLNELEKFPVPHIAKFICCAAYIDGKKFLVSSGELNGQIIKKARGKNGFGYDPLFLVDGFDKTLAEMELTDKNKISHRANAFNNLKIILEKNIK